jgi:lipid-binding SYLF domain-containing protein
MRRARCLLAFAGVLLVAACAHTPKAGERADLINDANQTVARMEEKDPGLRSLLDQSIAYIVFPAVGSGGFIVGGGRGSGVVFEHGQQTGFAELTHLAFGALVGGKRYSQIVIVRDPKVLEDLRSGRFDFGARASAVMLRSGAAAGVTFENGIAVIVEPIHGAMVNASLNGQKIRLSM